MIKSVALLLVLSVILCHFSAEAGNPKSDGIVSIRERRSEVPHAPARPGHRMRRGVKVQHIGVDELGFGVDTNQGKRNRRDKYHPLSGK
ncbi:hypothetical protein Ddc_24290 [Ditylenchus destructor]|nr:hypothetical protein Ddc_24290 [Ditylenchus destructor]